MALADFAVEAEGIGIGPGPKTRANTIAGHSMAREALRRNALSRVIRFVCLDRIVVCWLR